MRLPLTALRRDGGTQLRRRVETTVVRDYAALMREGAVFPPVVVFYDGETYWLADGFHRAAAEQVGELAIAVEVRAGSQREALLFAAGANAQHGLRRTTADKQFAIRALLSDPEWNTWSDRELARHAGVDHKTVAAQRRALSGEIPQLHRVARRGDAIYTMQRRAEPTLLALGDRPRAGTTGGAELPPEEDVAPRPQISNSPGASPEIRDETLEKLVRLQRQSREVPHVAGLPAIGHDRWWRMDRHRLFSGRDLSSTFRGSIPQVPFAFVDLALPEHGSPSSTPGAGAARSARELVWLFHRADVLAVAVSTAAVPHYLGLPELPYRGAVAAILPSPPADAAVAASQSRTTDCNPYWMPVLLFSRYPTCPHSAAAVQLPDAGSDQVVNHRTALLATLLQLYTKPGEAFVCLDAEAYQGYLLAEVLERACYGTVPGGGEAAQAIDNWQRATGKTAEPFPYNRW